MGQINESWPSECSVSGCSNKAEVGAHIQNESVQGVRIVPMCKPCNKKTGFFNLKNGIYLALSNVSQSCGRR